MNDNEHCLKEALEHNLSYQKTIQSNIKRLKKILIQNAEKQRLLKSKISKYDLKTFIGTIRGPKRLDFCQIPHWMFDTMDQETGTIAPMGNNADTQLYKTKLPNFKIDHTLLKFSLCEQRQLSKAIANGIRLLYLKHLHKKWRNNTIRLQDELNKIRIKDSNNALWPLLHWKEYPIPWQRIAIQHMQGRTASECKVFWSGHSCPDNPDINRNETWSREENEKLLEIVVKHGERNWISISEEHNYSRTPLQSASQWMRKVKPRPKIDRKWSKAEDNVLAELVFKHGKNNFLYIGSNLENRTPLQCSSRWLKSTAPYIRSGEWDTVEDIQCVLSHNAYLPKPYENGSSKRNGKHGVWVLIGRHVTNRNDVKARERYMNVLNPDIDIQSSWTPQEDNDLLQYHEEYGDKWAAIARKLGTHRTDCYCRQRYKSLLKKQKTEIDLTIDLQSNTPNSKKKQKRKRTNCENADYINIQPKKKKLKKKSKSKKRKKKKRKTNINKEKEKYKYTYNPALHPIVPSVFDLLPNEGITTRSKTKYLVTEFNEQRPFMGRKPNKFVLNQERNRTNNYIIPPIIPCINKSGFSILSTDKDNNCIDKFINKHQIPPQLPLPLPLPWPLPLPLPPPLPFPMNNNSISFPLPSLSGQLPINFIPPTPNSLQSQSQTNAISVSNSFQPIPSLNSFQTASNSIINEDTFKISFPLNNCSNSNRNRNSNGYTLSAPPPSSSAIPGFITLSNNTNTNNNNNLISGHMNIGVGQSNNKQMRLVL